MGIDKKAKLLFARVRDVKIPFCGTRLSAGIDFYVPDDFNGGLPREVAPGEDIFVPSGIKVRVPHGYILMAVDKTGVVSSRTAAKEVFGYVKPTATESILKVGSKIVDEGFQGELFLHVINIGNILGRVVPGEKLVQMILVPVGYVPIQEVPEARLWDEGMERNEGCLHPVV